MLEMYQLKSIANFRLGTGAAETLHKGKTRSISVMFHIYCIANALQLLIQVKPTDVTWNQFKSHMKSWEIAGAWICSLLCWCDWLRLMHLKIMWDHANLVHFLSLDTSCSSCRKPHFSFHRLLHRCNKEKKNH